ncbi:MAG: hypothetical protein GX605_11385, partial [Chloroflexi bacterium]|nr:hypothetical protein [Chloroflexota bacterium]
MRAESPAHGAGRRALRALAVLFILTSLGTLLFWGSFFADLPGQQGGELARRNAC